MPGCLGMDALWQLLGFCLGNMGGRGKGRGVAEDHEVEAEEGVEGGARMGNFPTLPRTPQNSNKN